MSGHYEIRGVWPDEVPRLEGLIQKSAFRKNPHIRVIAAAEPERLTGLLAWEQFEEFARLHFRIRRHWHGSPAANDLVSESIKQMKANGMKQCFAPLDHKSEYNALVEAHGFKVQSTSESWVVRIKNMEERVNRIANTLRSKGRADGFTARSLEPGDWDQIKKVITGRNLYPEQTIQSAQERESCSPEMSIVVLQGETIVGVTLFRVNEKVASAEARAVAIEADEHSTAINALMFERFVEKALAAELEFLIFSGDNVSHKETLNMARRFGGELRNARSRWVLNLKPSEE